LDGRREHVPVVAVRELEAVDQGLVAGDEAVANGFVDEPPGPLETHGVEVGPIRRRLRKHSSTIRSVQRTRTSDVWASRIRRSRSGAG